MSTAKGLHADKIDAIADPFVDDDRRRVR